MARPAKFGPTKQLAFRLPEDLVERLEIYAKRLQEDTPWASVSMTDVVRALLIQALDNVEGGTKGKAGKGKRRGK